MLKEDKLLDHRPLIRPRDAGRAAEDLGDREIVKPDGGGKCRRDGRYADHAGGQTFSHSPRRSC